MTFIVPAKILEGRTLALQIQSQVAARIRVLQEQGHRPPQLAVILVGHDPASEVYVHHKSLACQTVGIHCQIFREPKSINMDDLLEQIDKLNNDPLVDGILVQLPLPDHMDKSSFVERIHPYKDVDGFHPYNLGRLAQQRPLMRPCTPFGIMALLTHIDIALKGLQATVVGISDIVGRPMVLELLMTGCTVTACHRNTQDLEAAVRQAELLIVAAGCPGLIPGAWLKPGAVVIDVGMNRIDNGKMVGDVDFAAAKKQASWITPVPGGVGPMTVASLLKNTLYAYENQLFNREIL
jgi:methylenetetrahydrofolate dehydrogenase (NADP+) / methenyltetrahydrofolate cyclohydrolase